MRSRHFRRERVRILQVTFLYSILYAISTLAAVVTKYRRHVIVLPVTGDLSIVIIMIIYLSGNFGFDRWTCAVRRNHTPPKQLTTPTLILTLRSPPVRGLA